MPDDSQCRPATRRESGISPTPRATASTERARGSSARVRSTIRLQRRIGSTAICDRLTGSRLGSTWWTDDSGSLGFVLSLKLPEGSLGFLHIFQREFSGINQMRHHGLGAPAEQAQQVVDQFPLRRVAGNSGFENMEVAYLLDSAYGRLDFETVNGGLNRGVSGPVFFGKCFLNFPNGGTPPAPQSLHDPEFEFRQFGFCHWFSTMFICISTTC